MLAFLHPAHIPPVHRLNWADAQDLKVNLG